MEDVKINYSKLNKIDDFGRKYYNYIWVRCFFIREVYYDLWRDF